MFTYQNKIFKLKILELNNLRILEKKKDNLLFK